MPKHISLSDKMYRLVLAVCFFSVAIGFSQTDNYWSWNFNTPSVLLAGSVVGGNASSSSVFYNPSLIDNDSIPQLSVSANVLSLQFLNGENIAGDGIDADKFIFKVQPRFVSFVFPTKNEKIGVEAAILSPVSEDVNFTIEYQDELEVIERTSGLETYNGYLKYSRRYDDLYVGAGFSYEISDKLSVGVSSFLSVKTMKYIYQQDAQAFQETDSVVVDGMNQARYIAENNFKEEVKYWHLSFVFKAGVQYKTFDNRFNMGLNFTFPNIQVYGEGDIRKSQVRSNVFDNQSGEFTSNENLVEFERKVRTTVKTPFSVAFGLEYFTKSKKNFISLTAEYFHSLDPYQIASLSSSQDSDDIFDNPVAFYYTSARSLTNVGIGFKQFISPSFMLLGGFRTDFTVASIEGQRSFLVDGNINRVHLDKYHFSVGPVFNIKNFKVITGIQYTYGRNNKMDQIVSFTDPVEYIPAINQSLLGRSERIASANLNEIALFFGVTVGL